jgi:hypothetical protein
MTNHTLFEHVKFINFPQIGRKKMAGVYCIEGKYIGASADLRVRVLHHIKTAISQWGHSNKDVGEMIVDALNNKSLTIEYLDENPNMEAFYIKKLGSRLNKPSYPYHICGKHRNKFSFPN